MKKSVIIIVILVIFLFVNGCSKDTPNPVSLVKIESKDYGDTEYNIVIEEIERNGKTSKVKLTYDEMGSSVGSSMFIMKGFHEIAKARGDEYFTNLKEWAAPDGGRFYVGGFTNNPDPNIQEEFGFEYSPTIEGEVKRIFMSVSQLDKFWNPQNNEHEDPNQSVDTID